MQASDARATMSTARQPPFSKSNQLSSLTAPLIAVPDFPHLPLSSASAATYLRNEVDVSRLDALDEHLWIAGRKGHFRPLHKQLLLRRDLVITEDPGMHLVWFENSIFIKPCSEALLSWEFWDRCICAVTPDDKAESAENKGSQGLQLFEAACGFLYSYTRIIIHPSDYRVAVKDNLIPDIGFSNWCLLAQDIANTVSSPGFTHVPRWRYGELRLSQLNMIYKFTLRGYSYAYMYTSYSAYFNKNLGVLLLGFAYCSVVLAAMQVVAALQDRTDWLAAWCLRFSVMIIFGVLSVAVAMVLLFLGIFMSQFGRTLVHQRKVGKGKYDD